MPARRPEPYWGERERFPTGFCWSSQLPTSAPGYERLEAALDARGFLYPVEKRPTMVRNLRNLFQRAALTEQEVRTLHGIVSLLTPEAERDEP